MPAINGDSKISLRVMDWFVIDYSKKNNISYLINNNGEIISDITNQNNGKEFVVYLDYKLQLKKDIKRNNLILFVEEIA